MNSRLVYIICSPLMTAAGAATTIMAPMLLDAASFTHFAVLSSVFVYLAEFDLGLARMADRLLPRQPPDEAVVSAGILLFARYCIAIVLILLVCVLTDSLILLAALGGIAVLLCNGPLSLYRARANTTGVLFAGLLIQFGLTLPRLIGLLIDGVRGSMIGLSLWSGIACIVLNIPMLATVQARFAQVPPLIARSVPLFLYHAAWLLYLFANRWISWGVSDTTADAGLFAFGANLTVVGVGMVGLLAQPFYPHHLASPNPRQLARELYVLLLLGAIGQAFGALFCRFLLGHLFPNFAASTSVTAVLLISAIPLALSVWVLPLVIAHSDRVSEGLIFPVGLAIMYGLMALLNASDGIIGQAWGCLPPALMVFGAQLALIAKKGLLLPRTALAVWFSCGIIVIFGALIWYLVFRQ